MARTLVLIVTALLAMVTGTLSASAQVAPWPPPVVNPPTTVARQLIVGGGFEGGGWSKSEGAWTVNTPHRCGSRAMSLGLLGTAWISQNVTIPAPSNPTLTFFVNIDTTVPGSSAVDTLEVQIKSAPVPPSPEGALLATLATRSNLDDTNGAWVKVGPLSLSAFVGQSIQVWLAGTDNSPAPQSTQFYIDDVALWTGPYYAPPVIC